MDSSASDTSAAHRVLDEIPRLLPKLSNVSDSVEAQLRGAQVNFRLGEVDEGCRILSTIREPAKRTSFARAVELFFAADGACR